MNKKLLGCVIVDIFLNWNPDQELLKEQGYE